jgi:thymidylate synthase
MIILELLWFLKGQTDSKILEKEGINIWKLNTTREFLDNRGLTHLREGDLGELYGISFRAFNAVYKGCDHNHIGEGVDQIQNLISGLKNDPFSRRHLMTTFNPASVSRSCLWPCHGIAIMFYVDEIDDIKYLSCHVVNRSQDTVLGVPTNFASYAILTHIIAKYVDMKPKNLIVSMGDAHIYQNHYEQVKVQLSRKPLPFPVLKIKDIKPIEELDITDFELIGYLYHPRISAPMAV